MDFEAAERSLRQRLDEVTPTIVYEAVDLAALAKAILATREATIERGDRFALFTTLEHKPHRLYVLSRLSKGQMAEALGIHPRTFQRSHVRTSHFDPDFNSGSRHLGFFGVEPRPLPAAEADLRLAMGSPSQRSR